jgi:hypothetical protein
MKFILNILRTFVILPLFYYLWFLNQKFEYKFIHMLNKTYTLKNGDEQPPNFVTEPIQALLFC